MDPLEEIKSKLDIVSFISEYIPLTRAGRNFKAPCPFHSEKIPSFVVSPELQIWHCFGACGEGGDVFKFLMKIENLDFPEAVRILGERTGVKVTSRGMPSSEKAKLYQINREAERFYNYILKNHALANLAKSYLKKDRGVEDRTIDAFGIGFAPPSRDALQQFLVEEKKYNIQDLLRAGLVVLVDNKRFVDRFSGRIVFPLRDQRGNVLGFSGRVLPKDENKNIGKYVNTPETPIYHKRQHVFGIDVTKDNIKGKGEVVVLEGEFDLLSSWQRGVGNVVAIKGSAFTEEQARLLARFTNNIILALDRDEAGFEAARTGLGVAEVEGLNVRVVDLGSFKDPDEAVRSSPEGFLKKIKNARDAYDFFIDRAFQKNDPKAPVGVRKISQEVVNLIRGITDSIVKAHYAQKIADRLGISQEVVLSQVDKKQVLKSPVLGGAEEGAQKKSRRELLEESVVSLALVLRPEFITDSRFDTLLESNVLRRIRGETVSFLEKNKKFSSRQFIKSLPPELIERASELILNPLNEAIGKDQKLTELDRLSTELEIVATQEKINQLTGIIREKEQKGQSVAREQGELARLVVTLSRASH